MGFPLPFACKAEHTVVALELPGERLAKLTLRLFDHRLFEQRGRETKRHLVLLCRVRGKKEEFGEPKDEFRKLDGEWWSKDVAYKSYYSQTKLEQTGAEEPCSRCDRWFCVGIRGMMLGEAAYT